MIAIISGLLLAACITIGIISVLLCCSNVNGD